MNPEYDENQNHGGFLDSDYSNAPEGESENSEDGLTPDMAYSDEGAVPADQAGDQLAADGVMDLLLDVEKQLGHLRKVHAERVTAEQKLRERSEEMERRETELLSRQSELVAQQETIEQQKAEIEARAAEIRQMATEIEQLQADAERRLAEAESASAGGEEFAEREAGLNERAEQLRMQAEQLELMRSELESRADQLREMNVQEDQSEEFFAAERADFEARIADLEGRAAAAQDALSDAAQQQAELAHRLEAAETEAQQLREQQGAEGEDGAKGVSLQELAELAERAENAERQLAETNEQVARAEQAAFEAENALSKLQDRIENGEFGEATGEAVSDEQAAAEIERLQVQLAEAHAACQEYAAQIEALSQSSGGEGDPARLQQLEDYISELQQAFEVESRARHAAEQQCEAFRAQAEQNASRGRYEGLPPDAAFQLQRRDRLRNVRAALRTRADKVHRASEALQKRFKQCDDLISQRAELVAVRDALQAAQQRAQRSNAVGRTIRHVGVVMVMVFLMAGVSWAIASHFTPGIYAAKTQIAAHNEGREPTQEELAEWTRFHTQMLGDPRFIEVAAENMRRRGVAELGDVATLTARLEEDFSFETPAAGQLELELVGRGASRTQRELDILQTAMLTRSNTLRTQRSDPTTAKASGLPSVTQEPIDFTHLTVAGMMFGGLVLFALSVGLFVWSRLSHAKAKFEQQDQIDGVLDEERWVHPRRAA